MPLFQYVRASGFLLGVQIYIVQNLFKRTLDFYSPSVERERSPSNSIPNEFKKKTQKRKRTLRPTKNPTRLFQTLFLALYNR